MDQAEAKNIIAVGVMPGEIDSADYAGALRYLEALAKARILEEALDYAIEFVEFKGWRNLSKNLKHSRDQWQKEK